MFLRSFYGAELQNNNIICIHFFYNGNIDLLQKKFHENKDDNIKKAKLNKSDGQTNIYNYCMTTHLCFKILFRNLSRNLKYIRHIALIDIQTFLDFRDALLIIIRSLIGLNCHLKICGNITIIHII